MCYYIQQTNSYRVEPNNYRFSYEGTRVFRGEIKKKRYVFYEFQWQISQFQSQAALIRLYTPRRRRRGGMKSWTRMTRQRQHHATCR